MNVKWTSLILFLALQLWAQQYPATITLPVTYYDYHSNGSNPDFEPGINTCGSVGCLTNTGLHLNEVADTLDSQRKPVLGTTPYFSDRIAKWYRPWQKGDFTVPVYSVAGVYLQDKTINTDTSYINITIPDQLTFTYVPGSIGEYTYNSQAFFPLDGRGFGAEGNAHNFSFSMELHTEFTMQNNLTFTFTGDDDVFVFINGNKVVDLGGIHGPTTAAVDLNSLGLTIGQRYKFDLFYDERHVTGSDILITTNLFTPPGYIRLSTSPDTSASYYLGGLDTVAAGQPLTLYAHVFDSLSNWQSADDKLVSWTMKDTMGNPLLSSTSGASTSIIPTKAYGNVIITATFTDPSNPSKVLTTSISVYIGPGPANHVVIEADSLARNTRNNRPVGTVTVTRTTNVIVYAVVRDTFGNFVRFANNASWSVADPGVATATPLAAQQWAASVAEQSFGSTTLSAGEPGLTPGTAVVSATGPNAAVPVTATMLDTNGNGHLDRIDITLPDSVTLASVLPAVQQWIQSINIVSDDGGAKVTLTAVSMTSDGAHTIHIVLAENSGSTLETGWSSATIKVSSVAMTSDGRPLVIATIVDGAEPVVKSICFVPTPIGHDTLRVNLSSPQSQSPAPLDPYSLLTVVQQNGAAIPMSSSTVPVVKLDAQLLYVFPSGTLSGLDTVKTRSLAIDLEPCGDISIVLGVRAANNPFVPGSSPIPAGLHSGPNDPLQGVRVEVLLVHGIAQDVLSGKVLATISIFDAVGNVIIDKTQMEIDPNNVRLYFIWDGKTRQKARVAPGTYLARIFLVDEVRGRTQTFQEFHRRQKITLRKRKNRRGD